MLLDYDNNGDPDLVFWGNQEVYEVRFVRPGGAETIVWQKKRELHLVIPNGTSSTNLRSFIDARNPEKLKYIFVSVEGGSIIGPVTSGDLSIFESVVLTNKGEIQGKRTTSVGGTALILTSYLKLINSGWIRGAGGRGGHGGRGVNTATETFTDSGQAGPNSIENGLGGSYDKHLWGVLKYTAGSFTVGWYWNEVLIQNQPLNVDYYNYLPRVGNIQYIRGSKYASLYPSIEGYSIIKRTFSLRTVYGGYGGVGGYGRGFKASPTSGIPGQVVSGNNGGRGGSGGEWATTGGNGLPGQGGGYSGLTNGSAGGFAIKGKVYLLAGTVYGSRNGVTV